MSSCGCNNPTPPPSVPPRDHIPESDNHQRPSSFCEDRLAGISGAGRGRLLVVIGKCLRWLRSGVHGFVLQDEGGETYISNHVSVRLPENAEYVRDFSGAVSLDCNGYPVKGRPPAFPQLIGRRSDGYLAEITGVPTKRQSVVWTGSGYDHADIPAFNSERPLEDIPALSTGGEVQFLAVQITQKQDLNTCNGEQITREVANVVRVQYPILPVGMISAYGGTFASIPPGWLACDGAEYQASAQPSLYAAIGTAFGGSGSSFKVPDLRGEFPRGADNGRGVDVDYPGRTVGSTQGHAMLPHTHSLTITSPPAPTATFTLKLGQAKAKGDEEAGVGVYSSTGTLGSETIQASVTVLSVDGTVGGVTVGPSIGSEVRPRNLALNYIIFAGYNS